MSALSWSNARVKTNSIDPESTLQVAETQESLENTTLIARTCRTG